METEIYRGYTIKIYGPSTIEAHDPDGVKIGTFETMEECYKAIDYDKRTVVPS